MEIFINGEKSFFESPPSITQILEVKNITSKMIAIEVNRRIIPKKDHGTFRLHQGDKMEIVHPVGGG